MLELSKDCKFLVVEVAAAAGTTDLTSDWVDTAGYENCCFIALFGAITSGAVTSIKAQQAAVSDGTGAADLEGTKCTVPDTASDKMAILDIVKPRERYLACIVDRGTQNAVVNNVIAILYNGDKKPVTQPSSVAVAELHVSPAEGTA